MLLFEGNRPVIDNDAIAAINENFRQQISIDAVKQQFYEFGIFEAEQVVAIANSDENVGRLANSVGLYIDIVNGIVDRSKEAVGDKLGLYSSNGPTRQLGISEPHVAGLITENFQTSDFYMIDSGEAAIDARSADLIKEIEATSIDSKFDLSVMSGKAYNQLNHPTCAAFAATSSNEFRIAYVEHSYLRGITSLSPAWLYCEAKRIDGIAYQEGTTLQIIANVLRSYGQAKHSLYPYNAAEPNVCHKHNYLQQLNQQDAALYRAGTICINHNKVEALKKAISAKCLPYVSVRFYDSIWNSRTNERGTINMPLIGENTVGCHAICLVGYFEDHFMPGNGAFIFKNSWGESWAHNSYVSRRGYGAIPYKYMESYCIEAYAAV